jgi:hypothetical protein
MATDLGQAYVQIVASAEGISGSITSALSSEADSAGKSAGLTAAKRHEGGLHPPRGQKGRKENGL